MAELTTQERLQPALLDRLTDDEPQKTQESREQRAISLQKLRQAVLRDLTWLLNTPNLASTEDLSEYPEVARSVVNYGVPSFSGMVQSRLDSTDIERAIREAVIRFEPRLLGKTVRVKLAGSGDEGSQSALQLQMVAELWAQPVPLRMFMKTELDLELGAVRVTEQSETGRR
ncbi:MAG TPA: type VI secretion system baseplate subunit TssE [Stellaceae bacterium]|nr:type VI secretion system baseplate subunit TssE [Stellaceae bacterium]